MTSTSGSFSRFSSANSGLGTDSPPGATVTNGWGSSSTVTNSSSIHDRSLDATRFQDNDPVRSFGQESGASSSSPYPVTNTFAKYSVRDNSHKDALDDADNAEVLRQADWGWVYDVSSGYADDSSAQNYKTIGGTKYWFTPTAWPAFYTNNNGNDYDGVPSYMYDADSNDWDLHSQGYCGHTYLVNSTSTNGRLRFKACVPQYGGRDSDGDGNDAATLGGISGGGQSTDVMWTIPNSSNYNAYSRITVLRNFFHNNQFACVLNNNDEGLSVHIEDNGHVTLGNASDYFANKSEASGNWWDKPWIELRPFRVSFIGRIALSNGSITSITYPDDPSTQSAEDADYGYTRKEPKKSLEFQKIQGSATSRIVAKKVIRPSYAETLGVGAAATTRDKKDVHIVSFADSANTLSLLDGATKIVSISPNVGFSSEWFDVLDADTLNGEPYEY